MKISNIALFLMLAFSVSAQNYPDTEKKVNMYANGTFHEPVKVDKLPSFGSKAKNIILLIGDGMGTTQVFAALTANKGRLNITQFPYTGFSMTQSADNYITDSAAGGTALSAGKRTTNGAIAMDTMGLVYKTILEIGEERGKATGLVSTSSITHATPASFIAHQPSRKMEEEIALDFLKTDIDVFIGGGKSFFDQRMDSQNLIQKLVEKGYDVPVGMDAIAASKADKIAGFLADHHTERVPGRGEALSISTQKAIDVLSSNKKGFFLMVEGSEIDWGGHANNIEYVVRETLDFDKAVGVALQFALNNKNTLVIVTADHETGGLALTGGNMEKGEVKSGFSTAGHTSVMVPVFAIGPGAEAFTGVYKNTAVFTKMLEGWK